MPTEMRILGLQEAEEHIRRTIEAIKLPVGQSITTRSDLPYAWGIHFGRHRGGRLARAAGGAFFFTRAAEQVAPQITSLVADGIRHGPGEMRSAMGQIAARMTAASRRLTPVKSGALRASIFSRIGPRASGTRGGR